MDSIEKAMRGRPLGWVTPLAVNAPVRPTKSDMTGKAVADVEEEAPPSEVAEKPVTAVVKRTQRSVMLDFQQIQAAGLLVPDTRRSRIKEEYRHIKRPLLMNVDGKGAMVAEHASLIVVTSTRPGEGKTFTACNLALSIATERNRTVLLVDADIIKPTVAKMLGFEAERGLVDFLVDDQLDLADVLVDTNVPSLTILPAGSRHHLSTELLAGENMRRLATEMSRRYPDRVVIFDSPPLLATTEASVLARLMGQVVMVVEAERTQQSQVKEALALLDPNQIVGCVLNKARGFLGLDYYGYGYDVREDGGEGESGAKSR
ncbi:MAG: XrtA-associated tyrosine autokinase [Candidatus Competibacter sp.]|nr:XrtA-associated tyrosine autokinase [Candidatus Competibacter sp.]MDG4584416.1 XrtA-associated tyrosine autokinase [Candidatus Competibacter sp.]